MRQRISNWEVWGWLKDGESDRLAELHQRDLQVFRQGTGTSPVKAGGDDDPRAEVVSAAEAEVDQEDVIPAVDVSAVTAAPDPPVGEIPAQIADAVADGDEPVEVFNAVELPGTVRAEEHEWTNKAGMPVKAAFVSATEDTVTITAKGKTFVVKLSDLNSESQALARKLSQPKAGPRAGGSPAKPPVAPVVPVPIAADVVPQMTPPRKLSDLLKTFMDESNIKIGEFISGLLIVIGSIGLVVTLNVQFQDRIQYLPAAVFMTVVVLFHVAGIYSLQKWNLESSSKVVLYIASLLIPLNMLAATMRDTLPQSQGWAFYVAVLVGVTGFGSMSFCSARALMPDRWWPLMLVVIGPTAMQTVIKLLATQGLTDGIVAANLIMLVPLAMITLAVLAEHRVMRKAAEATITDAVSLLRVLTLGLFSLAVCVVVLYLKTSELQSWIDLCRQLASPFMILSFVVVSAGMLLHRRMEEASQITFRVVGTWMAITGCLGVVGSFALAVPDINSMLAVSAIGAVLALTFGRVTRIPFLATTGTIGVGIAAWCLFVKVQIGAGIVPSGRELAELWFDGRNALLLSVVGLSCGCLHLAFWRSESDANREFARFGFLGVVKTAILGVIVAVACSLLKQAEPATDLTVIVFAAYAIATLVAAAYIDKKPVILVAVALVPIAWLQAVNTSWFSAWDSQNAIHKLGVAVFGTAITYAFALIGYRVGGQQRIGFLRESERSFAQLFIAGASFVAYLTAVIFTLVQIYAMDELYQEAFWRSAVLSGVIVVLALSYLTDWTWMFVQLQAMVTVATAVTLGWSLQHAGAAFTADSHLRAQLIALSIGMLFWIALRKYCQQSREISKFVVTDLMYVDFVVQVFATGVMYLVWLSSLLPPLALTYGSDSLLTSLSISFGHQINYWDWILWSVTCVAWLSVIPDRHRRVSSMCALVVLSALPILATDQLVRKFAAEAEAFHHFLRWGYGLLGITLALIVCTDFRWWNRVQKAFPRLMDNQDRRSAGAEGDRTWAMLRLFSLLTAALPVVLLTLLHFIHVVGIYVQGLGGRFDVMAGGVTLFQNYPRLAFAGPLWLMMGTCWIYALRTRGPRFLLLGLPFWQRGWMFCGLLGLWLDAEVAHFGDLVHGFNWFLIGLAFYGSAWAGLNRLVFRGFQSSTDRHSNWKTDLFRLGTAARFLFALSLVSLLSYGTAAIIDSFVLADGIDLAAWQQRSVAFANIEAFVAVITIGLALLLWRFCGDGEFPGTRPQDFPGRFAGSGFHAGVLSGTIVLTLNALIGHVLVNLPAPTGGAFVSVTQVLFNQTVGWVILVLAFVVLVVNRIPHWRRGGVNPVDHNDPEGGLGWGRIDAGVAPWAVITNLLAVFVGLGTWVLFRSLEHNDWILIGLLGSLAVMFIVLSGAAQKAQFVVWAILFSGVTFGLVDLQLLNANRHLALIDPDVVINHLGHLARSQFGILSLVAILLGSTVTLMSRIGGTEIRPESPVARMSAALVFVSLGGLATGSVLAVVAALAGPNQVWIDGARETANLGIPLLALVFFARNAELQDWVRKFYVWGVAVFATLSVMWMVESDQAYYYHLNSAKVLYVLTAYLVSWGVIYHFSSHVCAALTAAGFSDPAKRMDASRLEVSYCQAIVGCIVTAASFLASFFLIADLMLHRYLVALLPAALFIGLRCLQGTKLQSELRSLAVSFSLASVIGLIWADLGPGHEPAVWMSRAIRLFIGSAIFSVGVAWQSNKIAAHWPGWLSLANRMQVGSLVAAGGSLGITLLFEFTSRNLATELTHWEVIAVCLGLVALGTALLMSALKPDRDPLSLTDKGRQVYVYLAELIILVLAAHLWRTRPEWFTIFQGGWPYVLFVIAFVGAFASEYLRRSKIAVLSEPIHNSSFLLPAVPILGLVLFKDEMQGTALDYQIFFFLAALINVVMAFFRRSFLHSMVATLLGNASLWAMFAGFENFSFVDHPQFWLIPPAVSILIAGHLNKDRMEKSQLSFLRYVTISVIYLASSAEIVLKWSQAQEGILALAILAGLAVLGVCVGMIYRIRQFVYLGLGFFLFAMAGSVAKITTYNQLWFWLSMVGFGALMLIAFAAREKYQPILRRKIEEMDSWDDGADETE
ncbi:MAG: hypothetical protein VB835_11305 [Pirellulales bacterium]